MFYCESLGLGFVGRIFSFWMAVLEMISLFKVAILGRALICDKTNFLSPELSKLLEDCLTEINNFYPNTKHGFSELLSNQHCLDGFDYFYIEVDGQIRLRILNTFFYDKKRPEIKLIDISLEGDPEDTVGIVVFPIIEKHVENYLNSIGAEKL